MKKNISINLDVRVISFLDQLAKLENSIKEDCTFVFPMTYGNVGNYTETVKESCRQQGIKHLFLEEFLSDEDAIELKFASEILVRLSKCDAFSLSLCETLAAGNLVIAASWLPYGNLRAYHVFYKEMNAFDLLPGVLTELLKNKETYKQQCAGNGQKILNFYTDQNSIEKLAKIYMN